MGGLTRWVIAACVVTAAPGAVLDRAGTGAAAVSGYRVQDVRFVPSRTAPDLLDAITFRLDGRATFARVSLSGNARWFECKASERFVWECPLAGVAVADVVETRVVAAETL